MEVDALKQMYTSTGEGLRAHLAGVVGAGALTPTRLAILRLHEKDDFKLAALCAYTDARDETDPARRFGHVRKHALPLAVARVARKQAEADGCNFPPWREVMAYYLQCHVKWDSEGDTQMIKFARTEWRTLVPRLMAAVGLFPDLPADAEARESYMDELAATSQ
jgi:hypothetical protein